MQRIYDAEISEYLNTKKSLLFWLSCLIVAVAIVIIAVCIAVLYQYTVLCTALCLIFAFAAYFAVGVLIWIKRRRLTAYIEFLEDLESGLVTEGVYTVEEINENKLTERRGLSFWSVKAREGEKKHTLYFEKSVRLPLSAGERYHMETVGDMPVSVDKYEN